MAEYVKSVTNVKRVLDLVDEDSRKWQQYANYHDSLFYKWICALESRRLAAIDYAVEISERDELTVSKMAERRNHTLQYTLTHLKTTC